jgi:RNA polymerase sigma-70 factor (ECF subfamily)
MLGAHAQPDSDPSAPLARRPGREPLLRTSPRRPPDSRHRTFAVLDKIEDADAEDHRLAQLVDEAQAGDPMAFAELYIALFDRVHRWLQVALRDREDAADAAQQVFLRAFEALPRYTETTGFRQWVFAIARNLAYDRLHAASRATAAMDPARVTEWQDREHKRLGDTATYERDGGIESLIAKLPRTQQRVLTLRFVSDMGSSEIGDLLGISVDAVRHVQHRALRSLAKSMASA